MFIMRSGGGFGINHESVVFCLLLICFGAKLLTAQVITLRHPETDGNSTNTRQPNNRANRFTAQPGRVIVHFDRTHEIQQLEYVLQDGRLATLYQRHPQHPSNVRLPTAVRAQPASSSSSWGRSQVGPNLGSLAAPLQLIAQQKGQYIDQDQTIDVLNAKLQPVSQIIGDHITIDLADQSIPLESLSSGGQPTTKSADGFVSDGLQQFMPTKMDRHRLDVLATVAVDALHAGAKVGEAKLHKAAGIVMQKLRNKVSQKLRELPHIVEEKLKSKSAMAQSLIDEAGSRIVVVNDQDETQNLKQQLQPPQKLSQLLRIHPSAIQQIQQRQKSGSTQAK